MNFQRTIAIATSTYYLTRMPKIRPMGGWGVPPVGTRFVTIIVSLFRDVMTYVFILILTLPFPTAPLRILTGYCCLQFLSLQSVLLSDSVDKVSCLVPI